MSAERPPLPFAQQRLVFFALLLGMTMYAIVVAVVLQTNDGKGMGEAPIEMLDTVVIAVGAASAFGAFSLRGILQRQAEAAVGADRSHRRFRATLVPLAMIEGGCLFGLTVWMLNGNAVPNLVVAMVLLSVAIAFVPFSDPEAGGR